MFNDVQAVGKIVCMCVCVCVGMAVEECTEEADGIIRRALLNPSTDRCFFSLLLSVPLRTMVRRREMFFFFAFCGSLVTSSFQYVLLI